MAERPAPRMTIPTQLVLRALLEDPTREMYGLEICGKAGLASGTIHPILARLETVEWLLSRWEDIDPAVSGRPRRRYYRLNPHGIEHVRTALAQAHTSVTGLPGLRPGLAGGGTLR